MSAVKLDQKVGGANLDWGPLFFSYVGVYCHVRYEYRCGKWDNGEEVSDPLHEDAL